MNTLVLRHPAHYGRPKGVRTLKSLGVDWLLRALLASWFLAAVVHSQRKQAYPPADFSSSFTLSSQAGTASFREVAHGLGKRPFRVRVYASPSSGSNQGFAFEGQGSAQSDDTVDGYGGLVYGFNDSHVRIWAPSRSSGNTLGRIVFVKDGWGGEQMVQEAQTATVVVEAWKDGPAPSFAVTVPTMQAQSASCSASYREVTHGLQLLPRHVMVMVEAVDGNNKGYYFYGIGSAQADDNAGAYGGVVFAYDENRLRFWVPCKNPLNAGNTLGRMIYIDEGWADGFMSQKSTTANVYVDMWIDDWPVPTFQTSWLTIKPQDGAGSYRLVRHDLGAMPARVVVQVKAVGSNNKNFVFEGLGSAMSTDTKNHGYGGLVFAYNASVVRLWAPDVNDDHSTGRIIFIRNGWGGEVNWQQSVVALVRVLIWRCCLAGEKAVGGGCLNTALTSRAWQYGNWSQCSVACNAGTQARNLTGCATGAKRTLATCSFESGFCGYQASSSSSVLVANWFRSNRVTPSAGTGPNYDHTSGYGYYAFVESSSKNKNAVATLTSPTFVGDTSCTVYFYWNMNGIDIGTLQVDALVVGKSWKNDLWNMTHNQGNSWRLGVARLATLSATPATSQMRFQMYLGGPTTSQFVTWKSDAALDDIKIVCDALPTTTVTAPSAQCQVNTYPNPGCIVRADRPDATFAAYKLFKSSAIPYFYYLRPSGSIWWKIASWKFSVPTSGRYMFWMRVYTFNARQSVRVQLDSATTKTWFIPPLLTWQWIAFAGSVMTVNKGTHTITLRQFNTSQVRIRELNLMPKAPVTYGDLGFQSNSLSDGAFSASTNLSACLPKNARLHSAGANAGGWCSSVVDNKQTLTVALTKPALIYKIAVQGRQDAGQWTKTFRLSFSLLGSNLQPYLEGGVVKTYTANSDQNSVKLLGLSTPILADKLVFNPRTWNVRPALRLEVYGEYMDDGLCASPGSTNTSRACTGDAVCNNGTCPMSGAKCQCQMGFYDTRCTRNYCDAITCLNNGTCEALINTYSCRCTAGWDGVLCDRPCGQGFYGPGCSMACDCNSRGTCDPAFGKCTCDAGYTGADCANVCPSGQYGAGCQLSCLCRNASRCDHVNGSCTCSAGYKGVYCDTPCAASEWGIGCSQTCTCQNGGSCEPFNGTCYCLAGTAGVDCAQNCTAGTFGFGCLSTCQCKNGAACSRVDGSCTCTRPGYSGPLCGSNCSAGRYGLDCLRACACVNGVCDRGNGTCYCNQGWEGSTCSKACASGRYGADCTGVCKCVNGAGCSRFDGSCSCAKPTCICAAGWRGGECRTACSPSHWGPDCANACLCQSGGACNRFNGSCTCPPGYRGTYCETSCSAGTYGYQCGAACACAAGSTLACRRTDGFCSCASGWQGASCGQVCSSGSFGANCSSTCRCQNGGVCHPVDGSCACMDGFTGPSCSVPCIGDYYGPHCTQRCRCANGATCSPVTGACTCSQGWNGLYCDTPCRDGQWGTNCTRNCSCAHGSTCRHTDGACQCAAGWKGPKCMQSCALGFYGLNCTNACPPCYHGNGTCHADTGFCSCPPGFTGLYCSQSCPLNSWGVGCLGSCTCSNGSVCSPQTGKCQCPPGKSGPLCARDCPANTYGPGCLFKCNCARGLCSATDGSCSCPDGYIGSLCNQACAPGWYGAGCSKPCQCLNNGQCDVVDGTCNCAAGWTGPRCTTVCPRNTYGVDCALRCQCRNAAICNPASGSCMCTSGWTGQLCDQACPFGFHGVACRQPCSCQHNSSCHHVTGQCTCTAGFSGVNCSKACGSGTFGMGCLQTCNCYTPNAVGSTCDAVTGYCSCKAGYYKQCQTSCTPGQYGANCSMACRCRNNASCNFLTGACTCAAGFTGTLCDQACPKLKFGPYCQGNCTCVAQNTRDCSNTNGACICQPGYKGLACEQPCQAKYFGPGCSSMCNCSSHETSCNHVTGSCLCGPGWIGTTCENACPAGLYGENCSVTCTCQNEGTCHHVTGACTCSSGYKGRRCSEVCSPGSFGVGCAQSCACSDTTSSACDPVTGQCVCRPGYLPSGSSRCNRTCPSGLWGDGCAAVCPVCSPYITSHCHVTDGRCACSPGFTGYACDQACARGNHGAGCTESCQCQGELVCNNENGACQDASKATFTLLFKTPYRIFQESESAETALEIAMDRVLDRQLFENPLASLSPDGHIVVIFQDNTVIATNDGSAGGAPAKVGDSTDTSTTTPSAMASASVAATTTGAAASVAGTTTGAAASSATMVTPTTSPLVGKQRIYSFNSSVVVRILSLQSAMAMGEPVTKAEFIVLYKGVPYSSRSIVDLLGNISTGQLDTWLGNQLVRQGGVLVTAADQQTSAGGLSVTLIIVIASLSVVVPTIVLVSALLVRRARKRKSRSYGNPTYGVARVSASTMAGMSHKVSTSTMASTVSFQSTRSGEPVVVMNSQNGGVLARNSSHLCFDNPYYDVMSAMAVDDDMDGDFINPLYRRNMSLNTGI